MRTITTHNEITELRNRIFTISSHIDNTEYEFRLQGLTEPQNKQLSILFNNYAHECGCNTGAFVMSAVFSILIVYYFLIAGQTFGDITWHHLIWLFISLISAAIIGKILGLLHARFKMTRLLDNYSKNKEGLLWDESAVKSRNG